MIDQIPTRKGMEAMTLHRKAMRGGDDTISYTQTGEIVIPVAVQQRFPALAEAAMAAIQQSGADPSRFVVGSPEGSYNPETGAQEFFLRGVLDYVSNSRLGQSLATGVTGAALAKISGASNKQALATGAGAGLGYAAGDFIGGVINPQPVGAPVASENISDAFGNFLDSFSGAGATGATLGGAAGFMATLPKASTPQIAPIQVGPEDMPTTLPTELPAPAPVQMPELRAPVNDISATLPQTIPTVDLNPTIEDEAERMQSVGVNYFKPVIDRDTGRSRFQQIMPGGDTFSQALNSMAGTRRRAGFGNRFVI